MTIGVCAAALAAALCLFLPGYYAYLAATVATTTLVGVGLNVLLGLAGEVSLGQVGFVALGGYGVGILTATCNLPFVLALPASVLLVMAVAALVAIPTLRVSGPYLTMMTIAFGFIVVSAANEWQGLTGGASGLAGIPPPNIAGHSFSTGQTAAMSVVAAAAALFGFAALKRSPLGLAMRAGADAPIAAGGLGIDTLITRALAFVIAAAAAGIAGGLQAPLAGLVAPSSFPFTASILFLLVVMVGGIGSTLGPLIGAGVVVLLPQLVADYAEYQLLLFGTGLFLVLLLAPRGLVGVLSSWRRGASSAATAAAEPALRRRVGAPAALDVRDLSVAFGGVRAVADLTFSARSGAVTSIIGPNGAGKTTLLNLIGGLQRADAGSVRIGEHTLSRLRGHLVARAGVARTYQTTQLFGSQSVLDNVRTGLLRGRFRGRADPNAAAGLLRFVGYGGDLNRRADDLPHVDRRLVEIARALATDPVVLLLDEPAAGLDSTDTARLGEVLRRIAAAGVAVVLVEHDMSLVMRVSDHVLVLDAGQKIAEGPPAAVRADPAVRAAYLGAGSLAPPSGARAAPSGDAILALTDLDAGYGAMQVLRDIGLSIRSGETLAVLGPNGAGKSTLMRAISGLLRPVAGSIRFDGRDLSCAPAYRVARSGLVLVPEGRLVFPRLSVRENLRLGGGARPDLDAAIAAMLRRFPKLGARIELPAGMLSGGEQQMLAIARGLLAKPKLLLLDEPSLGLAPVVVDELFAALAVLRDEGLTMLVVDQVADLAIGLADRCIVLGNGRIVQSCAAADLQDIDALHQLYMAEP